MFGSLHSLENLHILGNAANTTYSNFHRDKTGPFTLTGNSGKRHYMFKFYHLSNKMQMYIVLCLLCNIWRHRETNTSDFKLIFPVPRNTYRNIYAINLVTIEATVRVFTRNSVFSKIFRVFRGTLIFSVFFFRHKNTVCDILYHF